MRDGPCAQVSWFSMRILIADDEAVIRLGLRSMLQDAGHEVVAAVTNGASAVEFVQLHKPDLAILDIKMPDMDGLTAAPRRGRCYGRAHGGSRRHPRRSPCGRRFRTGRHQNPGAAVE